MTQSAGKQWFIYSKGQQEGPFSEEQVREKISKKEVAGNVHAWADGMENWKFIKEIDTFKSLFGGASSATPQSAPTIVSSKSAGDELSALIAVPPSSAERTGAMDLGALQRGQNEASAAEKMARDAERKSQGESPRPSRKGGGLKFFVFLMLTLLLLAAGAAMFLSPSAINQIPAPIGDIIRKFVSPLPKIDDVSKEDYESMRLVAGAPLTQGVKFFLARSTVNPAAPVFYVATNLPDGAKFGLMAKPNIATIVGAPPPPLSTSGAVLRHVAKLDPLKSGGGAVPLGDYQIFLMDADGEPQPVASALGSAPSPGSNDPTVPPPGRKLLVKQAAFLGGTKDSDYNVQLRVYHDSLVKGASEITQAFEAMITALESARAGLQDGASTLLKTKSKKDKEKLWPEFNAKWAQDDGKLDAQSKTLQPYKKLAPFSTTALSALRDLHTAEVTFLRSNKKAADHEAAVKDPKDKLSQAMKDLRSKIDDANQQAKSPWIDSSLLEKD